MKKLEYYVTREASVITRKTNLEHLFTFKDFPVFMGCTDEPIGNDIIADMVWKIDPDTGMIQLSKLIPLEILYMHQHMDATGATWTDYNNSLADFIFQKRIGNILEIGGGSGKLANLILNLDKDVEYTVVEPNPTFNSHNRLKTIKSFFSKEINNLKLDIKTIVLSQVLEHVYDPELFLAEVRGCLPKGGRFIFGYPNLEYLFSNKYTNAINFEHTMLMTDFFLDYFLKKTGFTILEKKSFGNHSYFYEVQKAELVPNLPMNLESRYSYYKNMFEDYISYHTKLVSQLNKTISTCTKPIYLFGAHIFSQYLIAFGLNTERIVSILDNSELKIGKRMYGSNIRVESPKRLDDVKDPVIILKAGLYNNEIKSDILNNINSSATFI